MGSQIDVQMVNAVAALAERRKVLGLSPCDVDARAGFTPGKVARWEDAGGPRTTVLLARWAASLGLVLTARDLAAAAPLIYAASDGGC